MQDDAKIISKFMQTSYGSLKLPTIDKSQKNIKSSCKFNKHERHTHNK